MRAGTYPAQQNQAAVWCYRWWAAKQDLEEQEISYENTGHSAPGKRKLSLLRKRSNKRRSVNLLWRSWRISISIRAVVEETVGTKSSQQFLHLSPFSTFPALCHCGSHNLQALLVFLSVTQDDSLSCSCILTDTACRISRTLSNHSKPRNVVSKTKLIFLTSWNTEFVHPALTQLPRWILKLSTVVLLLIPSASGNLHQYQPPVERDSQTRRAQSEPPPRQTHAHCWQRQRIPGEFWCT